MEDKKFKEYLEKYSEKNQKVVYSGGMSTCGTLGVVFVTLKLLGYINWSWFWVTAPFWGPFVFAVALVLLIFICMVSFAAYAAYKETREQKKDFKKKKPVESSTVNPVTVENSMFLEPNKCYVVTPEFISTNSHDTFNEGKATATEERCEESVAEEKTKKKRSSKRKIKKNVESNTTTETGSNE